MFLSEFYLSLSAISKRHCVRQMVFVVGDADCHQKHISALTNIYSDLCEIGESRALITPYWPIFKNGQRVLGSEYQAAIYSMSPFSIDDLACVSGVVKGGGILLVLIFDADLYQSHFLQRLKQCTQNTSGIYWCSSQVRPSPRALFSLHETVVFENGQTAEQAEALQLIERVAFGHRYRPLILTADRGRGKSHLLALAAYNLCQSANLKILIISSQFLAVKRLFHVLAQCDGVITLSNTKLKYQQSEIQFAAMDAVLSGAVIGDLCLVDEAATIPVPMLLQLAKLHPRVVFSSTVHGYEGTGRGFAINFKKELRQWVKQHREMSLTYPIRWASNDPVEQWLFDTLLLDAEPTPVVFDKSQALSVRYFSFGDEWSEGHLRAVFGLLIQAHYQTTPSDLMQILDDKETYVGVLFCGDEILAACVLKHEGMLSLEMAKAVSLGLRRVRGHLLPQSLTGHLGLLLPMIQRGIRVQRIVVHPKYQHQGFGRQLIQDVCEWAGRNNMDYIGSSFALTESVGGFWRSLNWASVRLGLLKDKASGCHSMMMVKGISNEAMPWIDAAKMLFALNFIAQSDEVFSSLSERVFFDCYLDALNQRTFIENDEDALAIFQIECFVLGGLGYDLIVGALHRWLACYLPEANCPKELSIEWKVMIRKILQKQSWSTIALDLNLSGRKEIEIIVREWVRKNFEIYSVKRNSSKNLHCK